MCLKDALEVLFRRRVSGYALRGGRGDNSIDVPGGGGGYSLVACLGYSTIDHVSLSRRSTVPATSRDAFKIRRSLRFFHILHIHIYSYITSFLFGRLRRPSISKDGDRFLGTI